MNKSNAVKRKRYQQSRDPITTDMVWLLAFGLCFSCGLAFAAEQAAFSRERQISRDASSDTGSEGFKTTDAANDGSDNLDRLEIKLFQHTYNKEGVNDRLNRLENLIFGQSEIGSTEERIAALLNAVPNLDKGEPAPGKPSANEITSSSANTHGSSNHTGNKESAQYSGQRTSKKNGEQQDLSNSAELGDTAEQSKYPAVTAIETKLLNRDYANEPIQDRLARLEKKVLGQVSTSSDLSERVDRLKQATGIDIARKPGSASDWLEDNDEMLMQQQPSASAKSTNDDFGNPNVYDDMQRAYAAGNYPFSSPYFPDQPLKNHASFSIKSFGLSQQVSALEHEIFHKAYEHDPLPARLNRLETTVFPDQKPAVDKPLPQRVENLLAKVPISQKELQALARANGIYATADLNQSDSNNLADAANSNNANSGKRTPGGLGKLMNSIGNMLSGGMVGGFPMSSGNYVVDPKTGMLIDPTTGTVINPNTGTAYGTRSYSPGYYPYGASPYGMSPYGMGGFGVSPFGTPYGMGSGFGFGNSGFGFGFR